MTDSTDIHQVETHVGTTHSRRTMSDRLKPYVAVFVIVTALLSVWAGLCGV